MSVMRILLDTTYLYWMMESVGSMSRSDRRFLGLRSVEVWVSAVSLWEMHLKYNAVRTSGQRKNPFSPAHVLSVLDGQDISYLPMTVNHAVRTLDIPLDHRDPFDRLLLVQAQEEGLRLLTVDRRLLGHPVALSSRQFV